MDGDGNREYARKAAAKADGDAQGQAPSSPRRKYLGVRPRYGNKFGAEIRDLSDGSNRVWLGTYDTQVEAAFAYDAAARNLKPDARLKFPDLGEAETEEERAALVLAHVASLKRKRADRMVEGAARKMEAAEAAVAAAHDAVSVFVVDTQTAVSPSNLPEPPTSSFPEAGEEDALAALTMLKNQGEASCKNKKATEPAAVSSSASPPRSSSAPAASASRSAPAPVSDAFNLFHFAPAPTTGGASASHQFTTPVLAPAPLNFKFPSPHAMPPPPGFHSAPSPAAPSPPAPAPASNASSTSHSSPVFDPARLAIHIPRGTAPPPTGFHLTPAAPAAVVSAAPPSSTPAPGGNAPASHFASLFSSAPAPAASHLPHATAPPAPGFRPAPATAAPGTMTPQSWWCLYQHYARFTQLEARDFLKTLQPLLSMSRLGAAITNTSPAFQPRASSSSAAPVFPEAEVVAFRYLYRMLEWKAAGGLGRMFASTTRARRTAGARRSRGEEPERTPRGRLCSAKKEVDGCTGLSCVIDLDPSTCGLDPSTIRV